MFWWSAASSRQSVATCTGCSSFVTLGTSHTIQTARARTPSPAGWPGASNNQSSRCNTVKDWIELLIRVFWKAVCSPRSSNCRAASTVWGPVKLSTNTYTELYVLGGQRVSANPPLSRLQGHNTDQNRCCSCSRLSFTPVLNKSCTSAGHAADMFVLRQRGTYSRRKQHRPEHQPPAAVQQRTHKFP